MTMIFFLFSPASCVACYIGTLCEKRAEGKKSVYLKHASRYVGGGVVFRLQNETLSLFLSLFLSSQGKNVFLGIRGTTRKRDTEQKIMSHN